MDSVPQSQQTGLYIRKSRLRRLDFILHAIRLFGPAFQIFVELSLVTMVVGENAMNISEGKRRIPFFRDDLLGLDAAQQKAEQDIEGNARSADADGSRFIHSQWHRVRRNGNHTG